MLFNFTLSCDANDGQVQIKIIDSFGWFESRRSSAPFELYLLKRVISVNNLLFKKKKIHVVYSNTIIVIIDICRRIFILGEWAIRGGVVV